MILDVIISLVLFLSGLKVLKIGVRYKLSPNRDNILLKRKKVVSFMVGTIFIVVSICFLYDILS